MRGCCGWLGLLVALRLGAAELVFDLTTEPVGAPPRGWRSAVAGEGPAGDWQIRLDSPAEMATPAAPGAASGVRQPVIAQVSTDATDERYPVLIYEREDFGDFVLRLRFKTVAGEREQMAGVAFRLQDERNFYVVRASALGNTFRFYRVFEGRRDPPIGPSIPIQPGTWHELVVEARGNKFRFRLDGREPIPELTDNTFRTGKLALWTKSDSVTYFTDLRLTYTPLVPRAQELVNELMRKYPRLLGLRIYSTTPRRPELHVVAASDPAELGRPGGEVERAVLDTRTPYAGRAGRTWVTTLPLLDVNGEAVAAVRFELRAARGQNAADAVARARPLLQQMQARIQTHADLTE